jgi:hypothetical protein
MRHTLSSAVCFSALLSVAMVACGPSESLGAYGGRSNRSVAGNDDDDGASSSSSSGGNVLGGEKNSIAPETTSGGNAPACATSTAAAEVLPVHMVVVLDRSGSMCEYTSGTNPRDCGNASSKWQQSAGALKTFFGSAESKGMTASLIVFPWSNDNNQSCQSGKYQAPVVAPVALPDTTVLAKAIDDRISNGGGNTPTLDAMTGAVAYAKQVEAGLAGKGKVVLVVATDGIPAGCSDQNNITPASNQAASVKATIPTYVIGVGENLGALNALAQAGGTTAFQVSTSNPTTVGTALQTALSKIRGASLSCDYQVPSAAEGKTIDFKKVNVQHTSSAASPAALEYSQGCAKGAGWQYDDVANPKKILLCGSTCDAVKADPKAKIDIVLGCETRGDIPK